MLHDVKPNHISQSNLIRLLWKGTTQKTEIKMPRGREKNLSIVAFLTPKSEGNPEGWGILKAIREPRGI